VKEEKVGGMTVGTGKKNEIILYVSDDTNVLEDLFGRFNT
jgi:hypothetical protein